MGGWSRCVYAATFFFFFPQSHSRVLFLINLCSKLAAGGARFGGTIQKKRKEKTMLAATATVSDSTVGISLEEAE